jgi:RluA family pseudouridine synthase
MKAGILLHRLDKETSGVLLFAKDAEMAEMFFRLFNQRKVQKKYLALVDNCPKEDQGVIDNYIGTLGRYQGHAILGQVPKEAPKKCHPEHARTLWQCVKRGQSASLIACFPETGRTHQLRVHLSEMGHPILGDDTYCKKFTSSYRAIRVLLHAEQVSFLHPGTQELVVISSPIPQDFKKAQMDLGLDG